MHATELKWIEFLQDKLCNPLLDQFFIFCDSLDTAWFLILLVGGILYLFNRKAALCLLFIFVLSGICNTFLKNYFQLPRPCHISAVGLVWHKSYGFPSGAAQTATIIAGFALFKSSYNLVKISAIIFALILCCSRIYLGVHFFTDIFGGIAIGSLLLCSCLQNLPALEKQWAKFAIALSVLFLVLGKGQMLSQATMMLGLSLGVFLSKNTALFSLWRWRIMAFTLATLGTTGSFYLGEVYRNMQPLTSFLGAFWFLHLSNLLTEKVALQLKNRYLYRS